MAVHYAKVFNDMFIFPATKDASAPIGVAAWVYEDVLGSRIRMQRLKTVFLGSEYGDGEVKKVVGERAGMLGISAMMLIPSPA
jgi:carbamoyltransferase